MGEFQDHECVWPAVVLASARDVLWAVPLRIAYLHCVFSVVIVTPMQGARQTLSSPSTVMRCPSCGGDPEAHVTRSSELCLPPQVIMLNYTWVEAFCAASFSTGAQSSLLQEDFYKGVRPPGPGRTGELGKAGDLPTRGLGV